MPLPFIVNITSTVINQLNAPRELPRVTASRPAASARTPVHERSSDVQDCTAHSRARVALKARARGESFNSIDSPSSVHSRSIMSTPGALPAQFATSCSVTNRENAVVLDTGTGFLKAGYAGDEAPRVLFPCMTGRPTLRYEEAMANDEAMKDFYVGDEAAMRRANLEISYPVSNGVVRDWEDMGLVWDHAFEQLGCDPTECKVMLTDPPLNPKANRERMMSTMFETYGFRAAYVQVQAVLTLYAQGLMTGVVVDSGDGVTHIVPVVDGFSFPNLTKRLNVAGRHVTSRMIDLLTRRGYPLNRSADMETARLIKEELCYVAYDYNRDLQLARETTATNASYTLPDGRVIKFGPERFMGPECLFQPELIDVEGDGISELVFKCIQENEIDNRRALYQHIVLSGGNSMYAGLPSRLERDIKRLYLKNVLNGDKDAMKKFKLKVEAPAHRKHMVFVGGAVLADIMRSKDQFWISKQEFEEQGIERALKKCGM